MTKVNTPVVMSHDHHDSTEEENLTPFLVNQNMPGCKGCAGARNRVGAAAAPVARPVARPEVKRPAPTPIARPKLAAPAKRVAPAPAPVAAAAAPKFEAKATPASCDIPAVCGSSIDFCYTFMQPDFSPLVCFPVVPTTDNVLIGVCASSLTCGIISCSTEVGVTLENPCVPGDTLTCTATVALDRVYLNGGLNVRLSIPATTDCGTAYQTVDLTLPVSDLLLCVGCSGSVQCPTTFIADGGCSITSVSVSPLIDLSGQTCPGTSTTATAYFIRGSIQFNSCVAPGP
jgi:hypothetical protein